MASKQFIDRAPAGYSHVVVASGGRTVYIAGQISVDIDGNLVGKGDFAAQVEQVFANLERRLAQGGARFTDVVKLNYYLTDTTEVQVVRDVRNRYLDLTHPPASTLVVVRQLVSPDYLIEVEAIAVVAD